MRGVRIGAIAALLLLLAGNPSAAAAPRSVCDGTAAAAERLTLPDGGVASIIYLGDVFTVTRCEGIVGGKKTEAIQGAIATGEWVPTSRLLPNQENDANEALARACSGAPACADDFLVRVPLDGGSGVRQYGSSGGGYASEGIPTVLKYFLSHSTLQGHYDFTLAAVDQSPLVISTSMRDALADASRDADFWEWKKPAAHAQAANRDDGTLLQTKRLAQTAFAKWEKDNGQKILEACKARREREAIYWLGYLFHGPQDLIFHRGISNAEHAWRDYGPDNPEQGVDVKANFKDRRDWAIFVTGEVLVRMHDILEKKVAGCWGRMARHNLPPLTVAEKTTLHDRDPDISVLELAEYRQLWLSISYLRRQGVPAQKFLAERWLSDADENKNALEIVFPPLDSL